MRSIADIVKEINLAIPFDGKQVFGIAQVANKDGVLLPNEKDTGTWIGIDDTHPVRVYHKLNGMTSTLRPGSGFGDDQGDQVNVYQMNMIVFNNRKRSKTDSDQMVMMMQVNTPRSVESELFKSIRITFTSVVLNNGQVWAQEYGNSPYRLGAGQDLFQISYTVEATFKKGCFAKCKDLCNN
jgi:hypothetical protein